MNLRLVDAEQIRFFGIVQGVGFRPTVAKVARELGLRGEVCNDGQGVLVSLEQGSERFLDAFMLRLPPLAKIQTVKRLRAKIELGEGFRIAASQSTRPSTGVAPDAGMCEACRREVRDPFARRYRYPFASCTHCGPRFSVVRAIPYDRGSTTLKAFPLCADCKQEFDDEQARHYHAQTTACHICGPRATLERGDGRPFPPDRYSMMDEVDAVASLLLQGEIVAVKGLGGYHLACDATLPKVVERLRSRKHRPDKPFALMARDLEVIAQYAHLDEAASQVLRSAQAPIVLLEARVHPTRPIAPEVAPHQRTLGFMLPTTPLHELVFMRLGHPMVWTSGNLSKAPQIIDDDLARRDLAGRGSKPAIADWILTHNRPIHNRVDDSVVQFVKGRPRVLRRARGYAPQALPLPKGFKDAPQILAMGAQSCASVALGFADKIVLSQHLGELEDLGAFEAWQDAIDRLTQLWQHKPECIAVDLHPGYRATQSGRGLAQARGLPCEPVQHHHAHLAAVLAEHQCPADAAPCLGIALDGLGLGQEGALWGGEFFAVDYQSCARLVTFKPVALLGGNRASVEPWRNLYAHLRSFASLAELGRDYGALPCLRELEQKPTQMLDQMLDKGTQAPLASSAGRLFDAVAAALGCCKDSMTYRAQAAMALEALVTPQSLSQARDEAGQGQVYPVGMPHLADQMPYLEWRGLWQALLGDLAAHTERSLIAARFHIALAHALGNAARKARKLRDQAGETLRDVVVLGGGCFQNRCLLEETHRVLETDGWRVLSPNQVPANDGCIALGQALVAAARSKQVRGR